MKSNNNILSYVVLVLLCVFGVYSYFTKATAAIVYVDINELIEGYKRTPIEQANFETKAAQLSANRDSLIKDWQGELKQYEKERAKMTQRELALKQELLSNKQQQINQYQQAIEQQISDAQQQMNQKIVSDINRYIQEYGKKQQYPIIFGASGAGNIMYAKESTNLTSQVLQGLNQEFEKRQPQKKDTAE